MAKHHTSTKTNTRSRLGTLTLKNVVPSIVIAGLIQLATLVPTLAAHPLLVTTLTWGSRACDALVLVILALVFLLWLHRKWVALRTWLRATVRQRWGDLWSWVDGQKPWKRDPLVPENRLEDLWNHVLHLRLALHEMTPEMEQARRTQFALLGEALPPLVIPAQNAALVAEFQALLTYLSRFGFPNADQRDAQQPLALEDVQLRHSEFTFVVHWGGTLHTRLRNAQTCRQEQQLAVQSALSHAANTLESISVVHTNAHTQTGYQRIQGALTLLKKMSQDPRCSTDQVLYCTQELLRDMETLREQIRPSRPRANGSQEPARETPAQTPNTPVQAHGTRRSPRSFKA